MLKFRDVFLLPCFSSMAMAMTALGSRRDAKQLPCLASTGVAHLGADVVFCRHAVYTWLFLGLTAVLNIKLTLSLVIFFYT